MGGREDTYIADRFSTWSRTIAQVTRTTIFNTDILATHTGWSSRHGIADFAEYVPPPPTRTSFWEVVHLAESRQNASPYTNHIPEGVDWCMRLLTACRVRGQSLLLCISRVPEPRARYSQVSKNRHGPRRRVNNCPSYPSTPQTLLSPAEILYSTCLKRDASAQLIWATRPPS